MGTLMGALLGTLQLFYPLIMASGFVFIYAIAKRSWWLMVLSAFLLYPDTWYASKLPRLAWTQFIPVLQLAVALILYLLDGNKSTS